MLSHGPHLPWPVRRKPSRARIAAILLPCALSPAMPLAAQLQPGSVGAELAERLRPGDLHCRLRELSRARRHRPGSLAGGLRGRAPGLLRLRLRRARTRRRLDRGGARGRPGPRLQRNDARLSRRSHRGAARSRHGVHPHPVHQPGLAAGRAQPPARPAHREGLSRGRVGGGGERGRRGREGRGRQLCLRAALRCAQPDRDRGPVRLAEGGRRR